jgi:formate dehydrogenase major subunit
MGSNMAENHPVGFQWVMEARERGARLIHVDPRFTRTSAMCDTHVTIRAGSDIAFLGGIVRHILEHDRDFREYVVAYTNAATLVSEDFRDTEDLDGLFSGWDPETRSYDPSSWQYDGTEAFTASGTSERATGEGAHYAAGGQMEHAEPPESDPTLEHPRCVFQVLKRHFARYTPEAVAEICGCRPEQLVDVAEALCANSGRERTAALCYAVGWTQHTVGVQYIRTAAIIQLLLGNIGRPGGGIMALRGHASIQGSTDIPTLFNILPGYIPMPSAGGGESLDEYLEAHTAPAGFWGNARDYVVSLLKAWYGDAATAENDFCFGHLPRIGGDHSHDQTAVEMLDGKVDGYFVMGENPAVGTANARLHRKAWEQLSWMVVRDFVETETAAFWRTSPEIEDGEIRPEDIGTEVFLMPAAAHTEKDGSFTNTQRLLQWHHTAVEPPGDARSELWFMYHLGRRVRARLAASTEPRDRAILDLTWDYPTHGPHAEPSADAVLREVNGWDADGKAVSGYTELRGDGSTACGCWIYAGVYADEVNQAARRRPASEQTWVAPDWGWAWPLNRRMLYNRASADPEGRPWSERKAYVRWDAEQGRWTGPDIADFIADRAPGYVPPDGAKGPDALRGDEPFVMQADGKAWLYAPAGLVDGPLPAHYEPQESPFANAMHPRQRANPARGEKHVPGNDYHPPAGAPGAGVFPYVFTTYRLTEHHTAGQMSRDLPFLAELQPEMFMEVSPGLAAERGLEHGGWGTVVTARGAIEARVLVTERIGTITMEGRPVHQIGLPYHWGGLGYATGDAANELLGIAVDPNVKIGEYKAATCDVIPGRRPRGPARRALVEDYRGRAGIR